MAAISDSTGWAHLKMGDATLQDVKRLAQDPNLRDLVVDSTAFILGPDGYYQQDPTRCLGDEGAKLLAQSPSLLEIDARDADLGDEGVCALVQSRSLMVLDLRDNPRIGKVGRAALEEMRTRRRQAGRPALRVYLDHWVTRDVTYPIRSEHKLNF